MLYADGDVDSMCYACACHLKLLGLVAGAAMLDDDYCSFFTADKEKATTYAFLAVVLVRVPPLSYTATSHALVVLECLRT